MGICGNDLSSYDFLLSPPPFSLSFLLSKKSGYFLYKLMLACLLRGCCLTSMLNSTCNFDCSYCVDNIYLFKGNHFQLRQTIAFVMVEFGTAAFSKCNSWKQKRRDGAKSGCLIGQLNRPDTLQFVVTFKLVQILVSPKLAAVRRYSHLSIGGEQFQAV